MGPILIIDKSALQALCRLVAWMAAGGRESKLDPDTRAGQHVDEGLDAEQVYFAANKIADPGLGYPKEFRGGVLRQLACPDEPLEFHHQLSAQAQALSLLRSESEVSEHVSG
jgi:hypothetical protein